MCGVAEAALGVAIAGGLMTGVGMVMDGNAQRQQAAVAKGNAEYNASVAELQARDAEQRGALERSRILSRMRLDNAHKNNAYSPFAERSGSFTDLLLENTAQYSLDMQMSDYNHAMEAWGHRTQAGDYTNQARLATAAAPSSGLTLLGAGGAIAKGVGSGLLAYNTPTTTTTKYTHHRSDGLH